MCHGTTTTTAIHTKEVLSFFNLFPHHHQYVLLWFPLSVDKVDIWFFCFFRQVWSCLSFIYYHETWHPRVIRRHAMLQANSTGIHGEQAGRLSGNNDTGCAPACINVWCNVALIFTCLYLTRPLLEQSDLFVFACLGLYLYYSLSLFLSFFVHSKLCQTTTRPVCIKRHGHVCSFTDKVNRHIDRAAMTDTLFSDLEQKQLQSFLSGFDKPSSTSSSSSPPRE